VAVQVVVKMDKLAAAVVEPVFLVVLVQVATAEPDFLVKLPE
jgi:hypothetical protein